MGYQDRLTPLQIVERHASALSPEDRRVLVSVIYEYADEVEDALIAGLRARIDREFAQRKPPASPGAEALEP